MDNQQYNLSLGRKIHPHYEPQIEETRLKGVLHERSGGSIIATPRKRLQKLAPPAVHPLAAHHQVRISGNYRPSGDAAVRAGTDLCMPTAHGGVFGQPEAIHHPLRQTHLVSLAPLSKFQTIYYQEHLRQLAATYTQLSTPQLEQLVATYAAFPLKRRAVRRRIGSLLCEEVRRRQLQETGLVKVLIGINGKDEKMKKSYCEMMGLDL